MSNLMSFLLGSQCPDFVFSAASTLQNDYKGLFGEKNGHKFSLKEKKKALKQKIGGEESSANMSGWSKSQ